MAPSAYPDSGHTSKSPQGFFPVRCGGCGRLQSGRPDAPGAARSRPPSSLVVVLCCPAERGWGGDGAGPLAQPRASLSLLVGPGISQSEPDPALLPAGV